MVFEIRMRAVMRLNAAQRCRHISEALTAALALARARCRLGANAFVARHRLRAR
jgi:hypothetical protein